MHDVGIHKNNSIVGNRMVCNHARILQTSKLLIVKYKQHKKIV